MDRATPLSQDPVCSFDNSYHSIPCRSVVSRVDQAHLTNVAPSQSLETSEPLSIFYASCDGCHHPCRRCHDDEHISNHSSSPRNIFPAQLILGAASFQPLDARYPCAAAATANNQSGGARPFEPPDAFYRCPPDAAAPAHGAHGAPGSADPFHFDWPHW